MAQPRFATARSIRNAIERARLRQADRLYGAARRADARATSCTIEAERHPAAARVFDEDGERRARQRGSDVPARSSSASSATPRPARPRSRAGSCGCSARTRSRTSPPTTTTATTASSARSAASRRCTPTATTWTSWTQHLAPPARGARDPQARLPAPGRHLRPAGLRRAARSSRSSRGCSATTRRRCATVFDVRVFLAPPEELRRRWKVQRDCSRRGYTTDQVLAELDRRERDSEPLHPPAAALRRHRRLVHARRRVGDQDAPRRRARAARRASPIPTSRRSSTATRAHADRARRASGVLLDPGRRSTPSAPRRSRRRSGSACTSPATCAPSASASSRRQRAAPSESLAHRAGARALPPGDRAGGGLARGRRPAQPLVRPRRRRARGEPARRVRAELRRAPAREAVVHAVVGATARLRSLTAARAAVTTRPARPRRP